MNELVNSTTKKLAERDETLEDMVLAMKKEIEELKGEVRIYKAALSNGILCSRPKQQAMDVPKSEKFKGARSARDVDNFLSTDKKRGGNAIETWEEFQKRGSGKVASSHATRHCLRHELHRERITELTVAMAEAESFVELGLTKDKFESSKPNGKENDERNYEEDEEGHSDDGNNTDNTIGNRKP
ncbi:hypothetical protein Godav_013654 [Gossypium davidsonii]|uniref:Uncharacterized protein n=2 Tax=Gossypium TaxID=3633 RepID=A0A7J8RH38_GOSDV|nr:hypothetical protein [Gossypium davidsonii]MBA0648355.1 hypothetical protein [Gossypium klotzschianum]